MTRTFPRSLRASILTGLLGLFAAASILTGAEPSVSMPPVPSPLVAPILHFRSLLAMTPEQQQGVLALKPEEQRTVLAAKLEEYAAMPEKERELRLRLLEIRLYLLNLMRMPPAEREAVLATIPEQDRTFVQSRLQDWSRLNGEEQQQVLQNRKSLHLFLYRGFVRGELDVVQISKITPPPPAAYRAQMIAKWQALPEERRQEIVRRFGTFLAMEAAQRQEVLQKLPVPDQARAQQTMRRIAALNPEQRSEFLNGLKKFADLDASARMRFLLGTERWSNMSAEERSLWRSIVVKVESPPLPPGGGGGE